MKRSVRRGWIVGLLFAGMMLTGCAPKADYLAKIQDTLITETEYNHQMALVRIGYEMAKTPMPDSGASFEQLKKEVLDAIVQESVLKEEAETRALSFDEDQAALEADQLLTGMSSMLGDETLDGILKEYDLTRDGLKDLVHQQSQNHYRRLALYEEVTKGAVATQQELEAYYEGNKDVYNDSTVHAKGLVFREKSLGEKALQQAPAEGEDVDVFLESYKNQEEVSFAGDWGPVFFGDVEKPFAQALFQGKVGAWTELIQGEQGYYLGFVYGKQTLDPVPFSEVVEDVRAKVLAEKKQDLFEGFVQEAFNQREISVRYDALK